MTGVRGGTVTSPHVLREYALIADGERGGIVGPSGALEWLCFPQWDGEGVFSSLIGGHGQYALRPEGRYVWGGHYEEGTLIWRGHWVTADGSMVECRDALVPGMGKDRLVLLRRVEMLVGKAGVTLVLNPRPGFGRAPVRNWNRHRGGRLWTASAGGVHFRWQGPPRVRDEPDGHGGRQLVATTALDAGERLELVLEIQASPLDGQPEDTSRLWERVEVHWQRAVPGLDGVEARRDCRQAMAVLHGLTSASGAMVAAATTSLPERADTGNDYDYRFSWIRDMAMAGQAVAAAQPEADIVDAWTGFVRDRLLEDGAGLRPAYTVRGETIPGPKRLNLPGYPGGHDTVGNQVRDQFQLDGFGEALLLFACTARQDRLDADGWQAAEQAIAAIEKRFREPDAGMWELEPRWWTASRLTCVAGLRAMAAVGRDARVDEWTRLADALLADTSKRGLHRSGRFQRADDDERVDAALVLPLVRGALPLDDPRVRATVDAVREALSVDGYVYRFAPEDGPLGSTEGAFLLCGFVMALADASLGDPLASARWFERTRASCGPPGLFSEEFDVDQRQLRGNLPQAFVHALLLEAAISQR